MKISNDSICRGCEFFEHDCGDYSDEDMYCVEFCHHKDEEIRDFFNDEDVIFVCRGYKE